MSWVLARQAGTCGKAAISSRPVTRGESTLASDTVKIDWLNATFPCPPFSVAGLLSFLSGCASTELSARVDGGLFGFTERHRLYAHLDGALVDIGSIALGGESQKGRWLLQLTGKGCGLITDWGSLSEMLESIDATITRVDLAMDFLDGEYSVDDAMDMLEQGLFTSNGRTPSSMQMGDWYCQKDGRTLYVGKGKNGKMLRVYEKGKQLKSVNSKWTRYEVQLGNRDRVIPFDVLTSPAKYFVGSYPALEALVHEAAASIPTHQAEAKSDLGHLLHHLSRCYGKALHQTQLVTKVDTSELIQELRVIGMPARVDPACMQSGVSWADIRAQLRSYQE